MAEDLERLGEWNGPAMAINRAGLVYQGRLDFWCTYHPRAFTQERWKQKRAERHGNTDFRIITERTAGALPISGSSTLLGVMFCLRHFGRVVVAGAPLDHPGCHTYRAGWELQSEHLRGRVRSMSGWTKTFLEGLTNGD